MTLAPGVSTQLAFGPGPVGRYVCRVDTNNAGIRVAINRFNGESSDLNGYGQILRGGASVTTAPMFIDADSGDDLGCEVVNVGTVPVNLQIDIFDGAGTVVSTTGSFTLAAGTSDQLDFFPGVDDLYRCAVTSPSSMIRVAFVRFNNESGNISDLSGYGEIR